MKLRILDCCDVAFAFRARSVPAGHAGMRACLFSDGVSRSERLMCHEATVQIGAKFSHWVTHTTIWCPKEFTLLCQTTLESQLAQA